MDKEAGASPATPGDETQLRDRLLRIASYVAPSVIALQGTTYARTTEPQQIQQEIYAAPILGPASMAILGSALATIGAYRMMKARKRAGGGDEGRVE